MRGWTTHKNHPFPVIASMEMEMEIGEDGVSSYYCTLANGFVHDTGFMSQYGNFEFDCLDRSLSFHSLYHYIM